ncbi:hypothetical protein DVH24_016724 [Malus domestica]|uniref:Uncharacterized protein n=1 Tax=Malus domestica TaxID=3750 RepID=A0A498HV70_MALDO|nr:hypothetical protein DVH24_016724 [Malus domestica]
MRMKVAKGRCRVEEVHSGREEKMIVRGEAEQKITQNLSRETTRSTCFRRTKRETKRLVPLRSVLSHVPNGTQMTHK